MKVSFDTIKKKLAILADAAKYDASCSSSGGSRKRAKNGMGNVEGTGICHSYSPDGRCISLLKILLTNYCIYDCKFCVNRVSSDTPRARFRPEEIADLTMEFYRRNYIEGLFLSSGIIKSSDHTMELLIRSAKLLRKEKLFNGYIHLKVVAGASQELIDEAGLWADRVSANIEMPVQSDLDTLAPAKRIEHATGSMGGIAEKIKENKEHRRKFRSTPRFSPAGQTTQMVIGATATADRQILLRSSHLYKSFSLRRVYYSAYSPIPHADSILPETKSSLIRENRLYQADWLLRFYGFQANELVSKDRPNLALDTDPKTAWALLNREAFPIDVNRASKEQLLRVPGFGVRGVQKILRLRRYHKVRLQDLAKLRLPLKRAKYFVITSDHNPSVYKLDTLHLNATLRPKATQLSLFDTQKSSVVGEF